MTEDQASAWEEVRAPVPQKQGLKPGTHGRGRSYDWVRAPVPQKQGLKQDKIVLKAEDGTHMLFERQFHKNKD